MMYRTCENCGANLDPGESCDCAKKSDNAEEQNKKSLSADQSKRGSKKNMLLVL